MPKPFRKARAVALLVAAAIVALVVHRLFAPAQNRQPPAAESPVSTALAVAQDVPHYLQGIGTVQPLADVLVTSRVTGHLVALHFTEGDRVKEGDLLAEIDPRPFEAALAQAKGTLARDQAELANARKDRDRYAVLAKKDFVARQTYDAQVATVRQLEGTVAADKASVDTAALDLVYSRITAPVSGRLGIRKVDIGTMITANDTTGIVRVTEMTPSYVVFSLPEVNVGLVTAALAEGRATGAMPVVDAWSRDQKTLLAQGTLLAADNRIDTDTGTIKLKAVFANEDERLFPNEFVNARLRARVLRGVVTVPPSAVQLGSSGTYVFVVDAESRAHMRPVATGIATGAVTVVESGLAAGETVVVDGVDRLREGSRVRVAATVETKILGEAPSPLETESAELRTPAAGSGETAPSAEPARP